MHFEIVIYTEKVMMFWEIFGLGAEMEVSCLNTVHTIQKGCNLQAF